MTTKYEYRDLAGRTSMKRQEIRVGLNTYGDDFETYYSWDTQGNIASIDYPRCVHYECQKDPGVSPDLQVDYNRNFGFLSSVTGSLNGSPKTFASSIWHHPNGMMARLVHGNGMAETWAIPANDMRRPHSITTKFPNGSDAWQTGEIDYDGAGNIQQIGTARFWYDGVQRLVGSRQPTDRQTAASANQTRAYQWDAYGNRTQAIRNGLGENLPISAATNRLAGPNALYDTAGNLTRSPAASVDKSTIYDYDPFHLMTYQKTPEGHEWIHIYDVDDERFWSVQWRPALGYSRWSLRGLDGKLLTEYEQEWINDGSEQRYQPPKDYIYREGSLLATWDHGEANQPFAQHLDHLGSPRLITNNLAQEVGWTVFDPFGEELVSTAPQTERMRFTGHERDYINAAGPQDDIDYMHARYCSPRWGRFLRVDPDIGSAKPVLPQSWNRYSYAMHNPLKYVDPDGRSVWKKGVQVLKVLADKERRTVLLSAMRGAGSERRTAAQVRQALDNVSPKEMEAGVGRVVETQTAAQRDAIAGALSSDGKFRGPEVSPGYPEHVNPSAGPYADVHVQVQGQRASGSGRAAVASGAVMATLGGILAPTLSAVAEGGDASPSELLSAAAWDVTSTLDPIFVTDLIGRLYDLP